MQRRQFLRWSGAAALSTVGAAAWGAHPMPIRHACLADLPHDDEVQALLKAVWQGLDSTQVWDIHTHLVGAGDGGSQAWFSPQMDSLWHPLLKLQKLFYMNAGCVHDAPKGQLDSAYIERLSNLIHGMAPGCKAMLLAFDWRHDENGKINQAGSIFHIPNAYAASVARQYPEHFEWLASIHPYRADAVAALDKAVADGARGIKWLPSAMGIDPASPRCDAFYRAMQKYDLPLLSHAGREMAVQGGSQDDGNPLKLRRALDQGVRVIIAHCASDGDDIDLDRGAHGPRLPSFKLFARMMGESQSAERLFGDISALTQRNRAWALRDVLEQGDWHPRLLHGSDYPLPGVMPLFSASSLARSGFLERSVVAPLDRIRQHNPLLYDLAVKRLLNLEGQRLPNSVFETRRFFNRKPT